MNHEKMIAMIGELSEANGAPGFEDEVVALLRKHGAGLGEMKEDAIRNLYIHRKGNSGKPLVWLDAHTDEVGFMVQHINADGTLKFITLGSWVASSVPAHPVRVRTASGEYISGIVASKSPHYLSEAERNAAPKFTDMVIDIGATSKEDAQNNFGIRIGEPVVPDVPFRYFDKHKLFYGKAFDDRIGCAAAIAVMRELENKNLTVDVTGTFTVQEEVGLRGTRVACNTATPDVAILFEGCPADDTFNSSGLIQTALKKGPMLRHADVAMITNPRFQRFALDIAKEHNIPVQEAVRSGGGTNGGVIHLSGKATPVIVIGLAVRYAHTHYCYSSYEDFENAVKLGVAIIERLGEKQIAGF